MPSGAENLERFPQTRWSLVVNAADNGGVRGEARQALGELCQLYWMPLYAFIRRSGLSPEDAEDATQDYLARIIELRKFDGADPAKGRLRSYLLTDLKFFLSDRRKAKTAKKRGGGASMVELDAQTAEGRYLELASDEPAPDALFERTWALTLLDAVIERISGDYEAKGRGELFSALLPMLQDGAAEGLAAIAEQLGMSLGAVKVAAHRMRKRYQTELRRQIAETLDEGQSVEEELRSLFEALSPQL